MPIPRQLSRQRDKEGDDPAVWSIRGLGALPTRAAGVVTWGSRGETRSAECVRGEARSPLCLCAGQTGLCVLALGIGSINYYCTTVQSE